MNIIVDLELNQVVQTWGSKQAATPFQVKSQDTPVMAIYFAKGAVNYDLGASPGVRFGLFEANNPNPLVEQTTFTYTKDSANRVAYVAYPNFFTNAMIAAIGSAASISVLGEIRYQTSFGTIARTLDIPFTVLRSLLQETILDHTTAAFTVPAVNSNVTIAISNTGWLSAGLNLQIQTAGSYQVVSVTDSTHAVVKNMGGGSNAAPATVIPTGASVGLASQIAVGTYPDPSTIELLTHKGQPSGYAGLTSATKLISGQIPVDAKTINVDTNGNLASAAILAYTGANFTTPAPNATVAVTFNSTGSLVAGQYVRIPIAGYYVLTSITDGTHAVLTNNGDPFNAAAGVTITSGAVVLPAQAAAGGGGGTPGQNAYTNTTAAFTVPSIGATVTVSVGSTAWMGGNGYYVFITGAGYFAISSISDATHVVLTNAGGSSNSPPGTVVATNASVTAAGPPGATGQSGAGLAAYDSLASAFTMPAVSGNVTIGIANTAWLSANQIIYIATAGYFQVASISSATQALITNLNYPGNATAGTVIASGSRVSPGGLQGPQGAGGPGLNAFTTLSANFTQPAIGANVTVNVGSTTWMAAGAGVFIQGGGYYTIQSISDATHAVVTNLGGSANPAAGSTVIGSGTQNVVPAGIPGTGQNAYTTITASFTQPAIGNSVTVSMASTSWMVQNQYVFINGGGTYQVVNINDVTHAVLQNVGATGNIVSGTVVPSGSGVSPSGPPGVQGATGPQGPAGSGGGGGTGAFDPRTGFFLYDDFLTGASTTPVPPEYVWSASGGAFAGNSSYGYDSSRRTLGSFEISTQFTNAANQGGCITRGFNALGPSSLMLGFGACEIAFRLAIEETTLPVTAVGYTLRAGFYQQNTAGFPPTAGTLQRSLFIEYSPDFNSGNLRIGYSSGAGAISYINCSAAPSPNAYGWWSIKIDATGNVTAFLNGVQMGSGTGIAPLSLPVTPILLFYRGAGSTTNYAVCWDALYINYPFTR